MTPQTADTHVTGQQPPVHIHVPTAQERFVLVHLSFSKPQQQKLDRKATKDAEDANGAKGAIKASRYLYPKKFFDPIISIENQARDYLRARTVPYGNTDMYLMDVQTAMDVMQVLSEFDTKRQQEVTVFGQNLGTILAEAQAQQGALFDPSVYPDVAQVTAQFQMHFTMVPLGDVNVLSPTLSKLGKDIEDAVKQRTEASMKEALASTVEQPLFRLVDAVVNIYDKLSRDDSRIHDSLMGDLDEITRLMPSLNVSGNQKLNDLAKLCRERLLASTDMVKGDTAKRDQVAKNAEEIARAMGIDTTKVKAPNTSERREIAKKAAAGIASAMKGFV